ncbi:MAG: hypothetical protein QGH73_17430 [Rhodospirillales bacterium]|jgi:hypothetical protein|nr:hypothetical protein [Rhodospirillaceae bacterium]MDP6427664.1 hypothetical protein [Rhodospirillales bacterium]MDP6645496.1 hypothetical protein [Rhodospirillales bacterium]MDP6843454.1 hypothetical protein [Rhodospirillales bacterium]|tara:strand:- start:881 stop:1267 length:387 start_codon:yes stop_codon:yes gene_type:complete
MSKLILAAAMAVFLLSTTAGASETSPNTGLKKQFSDHTLTYTDKASGQKHSIYLGRFGQFDKYFPCEFLDGDWRINNTGALCLNYRTDQKGEACWKPKFDGASVSLYQAQGQIALEAKIVTGNKLPLG